MSLSLHRAPELLKALIWTGTLLGAGCAGPSASPKCVEPPSGGALASDAGDGEHRASSSSTAGTSSDAGAAARDGGSAASGGRIDPSAVRARIRARFPAVRACYQHALETDPTLRGRLNLRFVIAADGRLAELRNVGGDLQDGKVADCVVAALSNLAFPPPEGGSVSFVYPMLLTPDESAVGSSLDAGAGATWRAGGDTNGAALSVPSPAKLAEMVHSLGRSADDPFLSGALDQMRMVPYAAVKLLVEELKVLSPDESGPSFHHVIWCIRALRATTGQDFRFMTKSPLTAKQKLVYRSEAEPLAFFSERVVDGRIAVAPSDVQQQVVDGWRKWVVEHGASFTVPEKIQFWEWYF